jgi:TetR/AcrR family transcriptional regulator, transcriptional repressor for nem operon
MGRTSDADTRLKDAALELIWEESYGGVSVDDICNRAGVKKGSFYYFFKSKAELAVAALEHTWQNNWKAKMDSHFSSSTAPLDRLASYLSSIYTVQVESKQEHGRVLGCSICSIGSEISTQEHDVNAKAREILSTKRKYVESAIRDAVAEGLIEPCDPTEKALAVSALIDGITAQARINNDPEIAKHLPAMAMSLFTFKKTPAQVPASA